MKRRLLLDDVLELDDALGLDVRSGVTHPVSVTVFPLDCIDELCELVVGGVCVGVEGVCAASTAVDASKPQHTPMTFFIM
jgi:hypothetical protein